MRLIIKLFAQFIGVTANRFYRALENPQVTQRKVQEDIFRRFVNSEYGKNLGISSLQDWQKIPIVEYQDIEQWIYKQQQNKKSLLTNENILFYEKTSGSSSAAKLIPYTKSLRRSFNQMFCVWAHDLIVRGPKFSTGKIYFCISPQLDEQVGTQVETRNFASLQDDSEYLDKWLRWILSPFLVSLPGIKGVRDAEKFKHELCLTLLQEENLEIISIWSPSFLKVIIDYIQTNHIQLATELKSHISPERFQLISRLEIGILWPKLKLISCWDSANAADGAGFIKKLFPNVLVQGKGLLATEAPMTIPLIEAKGCVPILDEVFFEFEDVEGKIYYLHDLSPGKEYKIILSQKGGLYRYRIGDRVRVTHFFCNTPCLEFLGRTQEISDLVGEKLHSDFVCQVLDDLPLEGTCFKSLVPAKLPKEHYILLVDKVNLPPQILAQQLDTKLQESPQYKHARLLGQLQSVRVIVHPLVSEIISLHKVSLGKKWGDLKHDVLVTVAIEEELLTKLEELKRH
jgi:GH3 auxin-responsive promoter